MELAHGKCDRAGGETQLEAIRDLMVEAAVHGEWLTLGEIAEHTLYGEASISAQLRHLRKAKHGRFCVEKRIRGPIGDGSGAMETFATRIGAGAGHSGGRWEYRIALRLRAARQLAASARAHAIASAPVAPAEHLDEKQVPSQLLLCAAPEESQPPQAREFSTQSQEERATCQSE